MHPTLTPSILRDETGYNTDGNQSLEMGWREVSRGLGLVLFGNVIWLVAVAGLVWLLLVWSDTAKMIKSLDGRANWNLAMFYVGIAFIGFSALFSYGTIVTGQWRCLAAPERRWAKAYMFGCMLCCLSVPVLDLLAGWVGGAEAVTAVRTGPSYKPTHLGQYLSQAAGLLGLTSSILFVLFLRAVAQCFDHKFTVTNANLYLGFMGLLALSAMAINLGLVDVDLDRRALQRGLRRGDYEVLLQLGFLLWLVIGWLVSYFWYIWLLIAAKTIIDRADRPAPKPPPPKPSW